MGSFCMKVGTKGSLFRVTQFLVKTTSLVAEPSLGFQSCIGQSFSSLKLRVAALRPHLVVVTVGK